MQTTKNLIKVGLLGALLPLGACGDLFEVDAPGQIADDNLNDPDAVPGLVVGMSYDFAQAMNSYLWLLSYVSHDIWDGGSYGNRYYADGNFGPDDVNGIWGSFQQARWVAEAGIERMKDPDVLPPEAFNKDPYVARAHLFAGLANRTLGEIVCSTVIDGGSEEPHATHFTRAIGHFSDAITIGTAAGADEIVTAAYAGRAIVNAWAGNWAAAGADAQMVPVDFEYAALLDGLDLSSDFYAETFSRYEFTVFGSYWERSDTDDDLVSDDPRVPWEAVILEDSSVATGANGNTPHYQQQKYDERGSDIPVLKGTEMKLILAENELRNGTLANAKTYMDEARAHYGMAPLDAAAVVDLATAWDTFKYERGATLWLEGRRVWDLRRWYAAGPAAPEYDDFIEGRQGCIPISEEERRTNGNLDPAG